MRPVLLLLMELKICSIREEIEGLLDTAVEITADDIGGGETTVADTAVEDFEGADEAIA